MGLHKSRIEMKPVESIIADTILQNPKKIALGGKEYEIARPTTATLIEVSKYIASLPDIPEPKDEASTIVHAFAYACDCSFIGDICAILILGKKNLKGTKEVVRSRLFGLIKKRITVEVDRQKELAQELLENCSNKELHDLISDCLGMQNVAFFLSITDSLRGANLLRKTTTTASGQ